MNETVQMLLTVSAALIMMGAAFYYEGKDMRRIRDHLNPQPADKIGEDCERLPVGEVTELQIAMNCNLDDSEFAEFYFEEIGAGNDALTEIDESEFFYRYFA